MDTLTPTGLAAIVVATGALGTAAFGVVEVFKGTPLGSWGFRKIRQLLGPLFSAFEQAYGAGCEKLLKAQYREGRTSGQLVKTLRQGVRVGLTAANAGKLAALVGPSVVDPGELEKVAEKQESGEELSDEQRRILARFELAVDARIDAALASANSSYVAAMRCTATIVAIAIALTTGWLVGDSTPGTGAAPAGVDPHTMLPAFLIGLAAVPLAPVAKDLSKALASAERAVRGRP